MTTDKQEGDWIPWSGGECPVDPEAFVDVKYRSPPLGYEFAIESGNAGFFAWYHDGARDDIIAYRVVS